MGQTNWKKRSLSEIVEIITSPVDKKTIVNEKSVVLCNYLDVYNNRLITKNISFMSATATDAEIRRYSLKKGDVVITKDSEDPKDIAVPSVIAEEIENLVCGYHLSILRPKNNINSLFLSYAIKLPRNKYDFYRYANGITRFGLTLDTYKKVFIQIPEINEQARIVSILSTWDEAIEKTKKLIELKEKKFKSLSNSLLFGKQYKSTKVTKWFKLPNHWKLLKVKDVAEVVKEKNGRHQDIPVLSCTKYDGLVDSLKYFDKRIYSENTSGYKLVKKGHFAYATNHIEEGSIGYQNLYPLGLVSPMYTVFKTNSSIDDGYLYKLLKTETFRHIFEVNTSASVDRRGSLRWNQFSKLPIPFPPIEEQVKINGILQTSKNEIDLLNKLLTAYKTQKRGLMHKLLTGM